MAYLNQGVMKEIEDCLDNLHDYDDVGIWAENPDSVFSVKSAWEKIRSIENFLGVHNLIWHKAVPVKWAFFAWMEFQWISAFIWLLD